MSGYLVLFQRQLNSGNYDPAMTATVFPLTEDALEQALKEVRYGFQAYAVSFRELPPKNILIRACAEAVASGKGTKLPLAVKPHNKGDRIAREMTTGLVKRA